MILMLFCVFIIIVWTPGVLIYKVGSATKKDFYQSKFTKSKKKVCVKKNISRRLHYRVSDS